MLKDTSLRTGRGSLHGVARLQSLLRRAGGLLPHERKCPSCGGAIVIGDDQGRVIPLATKQHRYDISCRDNDCVSVCGPSVAWCVRQWRKEVAEAQQPSAEVSNGGPLTHESPAAHSRRSLH